MSRRWRYSISPAQVADLAAQVGSPLPTEEEVFARVRRESRDCPCAWDAQVHARFVTDGAVDLEGILYVGTFGFGVMVRMARPCGMVGFWDESDIPSPDGAAFWDLLRRRAEKACVSYYDYDPCPPVPPPPQRPKADRRRRGYGWRGRR